MSANNIIGIRNQRRYTRIKTTLFVQMKVIDGQSDLVFYGKTCNISEGGLCATITNDTAELLKDLAFVPPPLHVSFELSESAQVDDSERQVVWTDGSVEWVAAPATRSDALDVGLAYVDLDPPTKKLIQTYIEKPIKTRKKK